MKIDIDNDLREIVYRIFNSLGVDLTRLDNETADSICRQWDSLTMQGVDFGSAAILILDSVREVDAD